MSALFHHSVDFSGQQARISKNRWKERLGFGLFIFCAASVLTTFACLLVYIFWRGWEQAFSLNYLFSPPQGGRYDQGGLLYPLVGTIYLVLFAIIAATPIGIFAGICLSEYADPTSRLVRYSRFAIQSLAGIPSVIFGLFGLAFFVIFLGFRHSLLSAALSVGIMILPFIIRTTEEAIIAVPRAFREASLALGATKFQTIFQVILPAASPGIFTGIMLGIGRAIAESAVLILAAGGSITAMPRLLSGNYPFLLPDSGRTLAVHLYYQATSYDSAEKAFATALILILLILLLNSATFAFFKRRQATS